MNESHIRNALSDDEIAVLRELMTAVARCDKKAIAKQERVTLQPHESFWDVIDCQEFDFREPGDDFLRTAFGVVYDDDSGLAINIHLFVDDVCELGVFVSFEIWRDTTPSRIEFIGASW